MKFNKVKYCLTIIFRSILITTKKIKHVKVGAIIIFIFFFGLLCYFLFERLLFHFRIGQCAWPVLNISNEDKSITKLDKEPVRALILTDLHLIGPLLGSKFEAIHKDWQMYHMFQTSINVLKPEVVFVLGDLTDEAQYSSDEEFNNFVDRFYKLFAIPDNIKMYVISGNHDIGFHYRVKPLYIQRFEKSFKSPIAQLVSIRSNHFVLLNNIGLEEDGCFLCNATETQIGKIEHLLQCSRGDINCDKKSELSIYTKPILLQHFPLYRPSDEDCEEPDSAPFPEKTQPFKEQWDCLGKNATNKLLKQIKPRLVFSGHTHHGCTGKLPDGKGIEITLPSFNWRHKNNPGFGLLVSSSNNYAFSKCYMPTQSASLQRFIVVVICMVLCMYTAISKNFRRW